MNNKNSFNIDNFVNNRELNILKAVLPFVPSQAQKFLSIYIAMKELSNIFSLLNAIGNGNFGNNHKYNAEPDISKIFESIKKFLDPSEVEMAENYFNMMNTLKMVNEMSSMFDTGDMNNDEGNAGNTGSGLNMDMLKAMLSPEQSAIFDSFSNQ